MQARRRRLVLAIAGLIVGAGLGACAPNFPTGTIEKKYYATGPWTVTVATAAGCCDSKGNRYDLYYPTDLGANGFLHPIITWGNGTGRVSRRYAYFLKHLASWGFVIIATRDRQTHSGQTVFDAANFLVNANADPQSIFVNKLKVDQIGAIGHSQGASGAINALIKSGGSIKTVIPIELPAQQFCFCSPSDMIDTSKITQGSVFFVDGSLDLPVSPPTQHSSAAGLRSIAAFYNAVPNMVRKLKGTLIGPTHNDVTGQPGCATAQVPCFDGIYGYLGYPTAWMMDQLQGDGFAHGAFVHGFGEMFTEAKNWEFVESNIP
jgi:hypothetical protein